MNFQKYDSFIADFRGGFQSQSASHTLDVSVGRESLSRLSRSNSRCETSWLDKLTCYPTIHSMQLK